MIKNGKLLLEGRTDEIVERFRLAEYFTTKRHGFAKSRTRRSHHFAMERKPLARAA